MRRLMGVAAIGMIAALGLSACSGDATSGAPERVAGGSSSAAPTSPSPSPEVSSSASPGAPEAFSPSAPFSNPPINVADLKEVDFKEFEKFFLGKFNKFLVDNPGKTIQTDVTTDKATTLINGTDTRVRIHTAPDGAYASDRLVIEPDGNKIRETVLCPSGEVGCYLSSDGGKEYVEAADNVAKEVKISALDQMENSIGRLESVTGGAKYLVGDNIYVVESPEAGLRIEYVFFENQLNQTTSTPDLIMYTVIKPVEEGVTFLLDTPEAGSSSSDL